MHNAHIEFGDNCLIPWSTQRPICSPGEGGIDDLGLLHVAGAVALVESRVVAGLQLVTEQRRPPLQRADDAACVGVEQKLVRIEAMAMVRLVGAMHAIAVDGAGARFG